MVGIFIFEYLHLIFFLAFGLSNENLLGTTETGKTNKNDNFKVFFIYILLNVRVNFVGILDVFEKQSIDILSLIKRI